MASENVIDYYCVIDWGLYEDLNALSWFSDPSSALNDDSASQMSRITNGLNVFTVTSFNADSIMCVTEKERHKEEVI